MTQPAAPNPARIDPPRRQLPALKLIRTVIRNPIEVWPKAVFEEDVFRSRFMSRDTVFVMDPDLVREVLVEKADAFVKAETMRRALRPALGDAILTADGADWRWQRRAAAPIFRHERLLGFAPAMLEAAARTRDRWLALDPSREVDVGREMMRTTFDIIVETMLSGHAGIDVERVERGVTDYLESTSWAIALTLLQAPDWVPYPGKLRAVRARNYLRAELLRLAAERRPGAGARDDLITLLIEARDPETGQAMSDRDVADNLLTFITAGHETTALALTWTFYLLGLHPHIEARVVAEIDRVTGGAPLAADHAGALGYTGQVLQEAMRLYPPAPVIVRAATRDVVIGAQPVARGTAVYVPVYALHRHAKLWDEPDRFDPDRFAAGAAKARHRYQYIPFGAGPRICIGMGFAMLEATLILATLLRATRARLRDRYTPGLKLRVTLRPFPGMPMRIEPR
ncbi:MAG TPA: cytochrome P450 [Microvirga sp.]|nr:cytochrome P450 [Microvirga sp.]